MRPVARYPPSQSNLANPFAHLSQQQQSQQQSHHQHPTHPFSHHAFNPLQNGGPNAASSAAGNTIFGSQGVAANGYGASSVAAAAAAAQMGFAHGALGLQHDVAMRGQQLQHQQLRIREVWASNLEEEMATLRALVERYPFISMDTEFPGVVARPIADDFGSKAAYHYQTLRCNVDLLNIIQLGITLFTPEGEVPPVNALENASPKSVPAHNIAMCPCTWTFNFRFSLAEDMYNEESIALLKKAGTDFDKHATEGVDIDDFGSLLITSGFTFSRDVYWISFHSGYDFGYLMKLMWCRLLPNDEDNYRRLINKYFPNLFDVKFMLHHARKLRDRGTVTGQVANALQAIGQKSSLQDIADELGCTRVGMQHTAGSDAWLTGLVFWEIRKRIFENQVPEELNGQMWGLTGVGPPASTAAQAAALAAQNQAVANGLLSGSAFMSQMQTHHRDGGPSTPTTIPTGLASTPSQAYQGSGITPAAGGTFGQFQYGK